MTSIRSALSSSPPPACSSSRLLMPNPCRRSEGVTSSSSMRRTLRPANAPRSNARCVSNRHSSTPVPRHRSPSRAMCSATPSIGTSLLKQGSQRSLMMKSKTVGASADGPSQPKLATKTVCKESRTARAGSPRRPPQARAISSSSPAAIVDRPGRSPRPPYLPAT